MYGERIRDLRIEKGMNQESLGSIFNLSRQAISSWENETNEPDITALIKLSEVFGVSVDYIIGANNIKLNYRFDPKLELYLIDCIKTYEKHIKKD